MATILVLHGPNLNLLGSREPERYGHETLQSLDNRLTGLARQWGHSLAIWQSNSEAELIEKIHACPHTKTDFIIFNPAAYTHTSIALRDALLSVAVPFIEVHLSNLAAREAFRQQSFFSDIALGTISGLGTEGYLLALRYAHTYMTSTQPELT
jgi:3-dehydroquinate dehydratase-2